MNHFPKIVVSLLAFVGISCSRSKLGENTIVDPPWPTDPLSNYDPSEGDKIYAIQGGDTPWGGYGGILVHGMTAHLGREMGKDGAIQLERTGPYVPPITFPGVADILVTSKMKEAMEKAGFKGISFKRVKKVHVVEVRWETWDLTTEEPLYYPEEGEPEGYILDKPHSKMLAWKLGDIWEVVTIEGAKMERIENGGNKWHPKFKYIEGSWSGADIFGVNGNCGKYVSPRARAWFERNFKRWTGFEDTQ